jgi:hypothetical protein
MLRCRSLLKQAGVRKVALEFELGVGRGESLPGRKVKEENGNKSEAKYTRHKLQKTLHALLGQSPIESDTDDYNRDMIPVWTATAVMIRRSVQSSA